MTFRVITINVNGIRSAARKGLFPWLSKQNADVICLQEVRCQNELFDDAAYSLPNYFGYANCAQKKGYSGVALFTKHKPKTHTDKLGFHIADHEGRYLAVDLGKLWVASLYMPSGTSGEIRQKIKFNFLDEYLQFLQQIKNENYIICGDWNIAHTKADLKNWRSNQKNSGFLPEERAWMDKILHDVGFVDAFREVDQREEQYTWWSNRGAAWAKNVGWRIDYQILTPSLKGKARRAFIYKEERFSDHAPLIMDYDICLD